MEESCVRDLSDRRGSGTGRAYTGGPTVGCWLHVFDCPEDTDAYEAGKLAPTPVRRTMQAMPMFNARVLSEFRESSKLRYGVRAMVKMVKMVNSGAVGNAVTGRRRRAIACHPRQSFIRRCAAHICRQPCHPVAQHLCSVET